MLSHTPAPQAALARFTKVNPHIFVLPTIPWSFTVLVFEAMSTPTPLAAGPRAWSNAWSGKRRSAGTLVSKEGVRSPVVIKDLPTIDEAGDPSTRLREVARQEALDHCRWMTRLRTSILPVRAVQDDVSGGRVRIVTDLYDATLAQWIKQWPEGHTRERPWVRRFLHPPSPRDPQRDHSPCRRSA